MRHDQDDLNLSSNRQGGWFDGVSQGDQEKSGGWRRVAAAARSDTGPRCESSAVKAPSAFSNNTVPIGIQGHWWARLALPDRR